MQRFAVHTRSLALLVSCCVACNDDALSVEETQSVSSAVAEPVASTEPGFLTIACNPYCEDIKEGDKSLGPSPLVHHAMPAGSHTITLVAKGREYARCGVGNSLRQDDRPPGATSIVQRRPIRLL